MVGLHPGTLPYCTPYEVAKHSSPQDCWVSVYGKVLDVTKLVKEHRGVLAEPILRFAGSDISHWFSKGSDGQLQPKTHVCPVTNLVVPYCPQGRFIHVAATAPTTDWNCEITVPWWNNPKYVVGQLPSSCRLIRIKNMLTRQEDVLEVPSEETVAGIRQRYLALNAHAHAYIWKAFLPNAAGVLEPQEVDMQRTLAENGVPDERANFEACQLPPDFFVPVLHLFWADDLTVA